MTTTTTRDGYDLVITFEGNRFWASIYREGSEVLVQPRKSFSSAERALPWFEKFLACKSS